MAQDELETPSEAFFRILYLRGQFSLEQREVLKDALEEALALYGKTYVSLLTDRFAALLEKQQATLEVRQKAMLLNLLRELVRQQTEQLDWQKFLDSIDESEPPVPQ